MLTAPVEGSLEGESLEDADLEDGEAGEAEAAEEEGLGLDHDGHRGQEDEDVDQGVHLKNELVVHFMFIKDGNEILVLSIFDKVKNVC